MVGDLVARDSEQPGQRWVRSLLKFSPGDHETGRHHVVNLRARQPTIDVLEQSLIVIAKEILEAIEDHIVDRSTRMLHYFLYVTG